jgi:hypothetical protein
MKLIDRKYWALKPEAKYIRDEVVIAQAWKKAHNYIRNHNWYADPLALDVSSLSLEVNVKKWSGLSSYKPRKLELVPAAKSCEWEINSSGEWRCKESKGLKLRPLAHILIAEQTTSTAIMMCLADAVETAQGDCGEEDLYKAQRKNVYSYGNRLLCDWKNDVAWFRWGNSETYRRFFVDYQRFLRRPISIGRDVSKNHLGQDNVFVVSLDISKFYDCVDRSFLIRRLQTIASKYGQYKGDDEFWNIATEIMDWSWDEEAIGKQSELGLDLRVGLPQGLVASGFFANAFLVDFDRKIGCLIGKNFPAMQGVMVHDYCRYVDDLRLVVSVDEHYNHGSLRDLLKKISVVISGILSLDGHENLKLNEGKQKIIALSDLDSAGSLAGRLELIQGDLSGPADRDLLDSAMGVLEGLLSIQPNNVPTADDPALQELIEITNFDHNVQAGTLKRFSANRLEAIIRNKRKLEFPAAGGDEFAHRGEIDNESELLAKKLIAVWVQDPSLALVLRKAFEIYPSDELFEPVLKAIYSRTAYSNPDENKIIAASMNYLLADVFRFCIDFNGFYQNRNYPASAHPQGMLEAAARWAQKIVCCDAAPKFLLRQSLLLLAVLQKIANPSPHRYFPEMHARLHQVMAGSTLTYDAQSLALFEIAGQITGQWRTAATQMLDHLSDSKLMAIEADLEPFAKRGGEFWVELWKQIKSQKSVAKKLKWAAPTIVADPKPTRQKLSRVLASNSNGFEHEAGLVKLALGLIKLAIRNPAHIPLSPDQISITQTPSAIVPWANIWDPKVEEINCSDNNFSGTDDPRFHVPGWVRASEFDFKAIYWIGSILRAAAIGGVDFTGNRWKKSSINNYKGLKTNWYKRRMGMMHSPETLVGEYATASAWMSELIMKCLQWPGFEASHIQHEDIADFANLKDLEKTLKRRRSTLDALFCRASNIPLLPTKVRRPMTGRNGTFRLVSVQQLLPRTSDFSKADIGLNDPTMRVKNRDQLSRICQLIHKTLTTKLNADGDDGKVGADLIVFPEVGVHEDDQDLLKLLANKTKSIIFSGLIFVEENGNFVNRARWFIPDYRESGRQWIIRDQGKAFMTKVEECLGIQPHRPCQHLIEISDPDGTSFTLTGAICYDATDLNLVADLKGKTDLFVICAHNKDVRTFDVMASALHYHMYQHVVVVNKGEFGGSTIQAPYKEQHDRLITHVHGTDQISINIADLDLAAFKRQHKNYKAVKYQPAGLA